MQSVVRERLDEAFAAITAPGSPSLLPDAVTLSHYQAHGAPSDVLDRARIAVRSAGRRALGRIEGLRG